LSQVFGFGRVSYHAQAYGIHASAIQAIEAFKRGSIALAGSPNGLRFTQFTASDRKDWRRSLLRDAFRVGM
jgi:hypothetical protein